MPTDLDRFARIGAALFPIPANAKNPTGIVSSFVTDCSRDPAQWDTWSRANPGCNWGMVAGPSRKIIVDIDAKKVGREAAWSAWHNWCTSHGLPTTAPDVQTPSGGWHIYFDCVNPDLHQPPLVPGIIDVRAGNGFVVVPPSVIDGKPYLWMA